MANRTFSQRERQRLLDTFRPKIFFHKDEKYLPINGYKTFNENIIIDGNLELKNVDLNDHTCGAQVYVNSEGVVFLQYFYHFIYNGSQSFVVTKLNGKKKTFSFKKLGEHSGDIEFLTLQLSEDLTKIDFILPSTHGSIVKTNQFLLQDNRPIIYCALETHGFYLSSGIKIIENNQFDSVFKYLIPIAFLGKYTEARLCDVVPFLPTDFNEFIWGEKDQVQDFTPLRFCSENRELTKFETTTFLFGLPIDNTKIIKPSISGGLIFWVIAVFAKWAGLLKNFMSEKQMSPGNFIGRNEWNNPEELHN